MQAQGGGGGEWADSSYLGDVNKYSNRVDEALPTSAHHPQHAVSHPLVWRHPTTGRNAVQVHAVCMHHVEHVEGDGHLSWEDSMRLIERAIVDKGAQPETVYCHAWREKDLINLGQPAAVASCPPRRICERRGTARHAPRGVAWQVVARRAAGRRWEGNRIEQPV